MARAILVGDDGKRFTKEGKHVTVVVGVVSGKEYYELSINAYDESVEHGRRGEVIVTKVTSYNPKPTEVYRVPATKKVRKKAPKGQEAPPVD